MDNIPVLTDIVPCPKTASEQMENATQQAIRESMENQDLQLATHITKDHYSDDALVSMIDFDALWREI